MTRFELLYLLPYIASLLLAIGISLYVWQRRQTQGTAAYLWYATGQALWIFGFIMELVSVNVYAKIFWDDFQWLATSLITIAFPVFAIQYTGYNIPKPKRAFYISQIVPAAFLLLLATDSFHHLIRTNLHLNSVRPFFQLTYDFTPVVYFYAAYSYILGFVGIGFLIRRYIWPNNLYRPQIAVITLGFLIPMIGTFLALAGIHILPQRDISPFTIALGNVLIVWGLFRFQLFDVVPIGRDKVFEDMVDPVVILDNHNRIIDINQSMLDMLGMKSSEVVGASAKEIFADFPIPIKLYTGVSHARVDTSFELSKKNVYYELTVWPLYNQSKKIIGRIFISHDITAQKELEYTLRRLNDELEQRVQARTEELAASYDITLEGWARALEFRDKETEGHSRRVTETTIKIARALDIPEDELVHIYRGAILHDIGKMAVPDDILRKAGSLTNDELGIIRNHPEIARQLLEPIPYLRKAMEIPYCHHERWDGTGYPRGLKGREIPVAARIFAIADVWDAVQADRPYKKGWPREQAIQYIKDKTGTHFDPHIADVFLRLVEKGEI